jgi:VIT1/CCC1 family predicted Fe2+/Mn2+ transporter
MPTVPHIEQHFKAPDSVRDVVIGMSDGLTVPFALAAGLSGAVMATSLVVTAGFAEIVAGSIAMGLGGYLAARTDEHHYRAELARERREVIELPEREADEVREILTSFGLDTAQAGVVLSGLRANPERWVEFMMRFELGLEAPMPGRAWKSAATIATSYAVGGCIPLLPYIFLKSVTAAVGWSVAATVVALLVFGFVKARLTGVNPVRGAVQTALIGGLAAAAAFGIAKLIEQHHG